MKYIKSNLRGLKIQNFVNVTFTGTLRMHQNNVYESNYNFLMLPVHSEVLDNDVLFNICKSLKRKNFLLRIFKPEPNVLKLLLTIPSKISQKFLLLFCFYSWISLPIVTYICKFYKVAINKHSILPSLLQP